MMKKFLIVSTTLLLATHSYAESARLVDVKTGETSAYTALTNGAHIVVGEKTYRLEIKQTDDEKFIQTLRQKTITIRFMGTAEETFSFLSSIIGTPIDCSPKVNKKTKIDLNIDDQSIWEAIESICFQMDAKASVKNKSIRIEPNEKKKEAPNTPTVQPKPSE